MGGLLIILLMIFVYFMPGIIASSRKHHNANAIALVNLFAGWTVLGWFIAFVWAFTNPPPRS